MLFEEDEELSLDELTENIILDAQNEYIADSKKAVELIAQIVHNEKIEKNNCDYVIKSRIQKVFQFMSECNISDTFEQQRKFEILLKRLIEWGTAGVLSGKHVVSLGGRFSSGKSQFINAITGNEDTLPIDQNPTTSVPSYIVYCDQDEIEANTVFGYSCKLTSEAMKALSHEFYNKYKIGFSSVLENIIIRTSEYSIDKSIVLLDTPGYSKADAENNIREKNSDKQKAYEKLIITDYMIWLVDIENGTITSEDLDFINGLKLQTKILFVFTKADKFTEDAIRQVLELAKRTINDSGIPCFAVTAYSSIEKNEYFGNYISEFLSYVGKSNKRDNDIIIQIKELENSIRSMLIKEKHESEKKEKEFFKVLSQAKNITSIRSIANMWKYENIRLRKIGKLIYQFDGLCSDMDDYISQKVEEL